MLRRFSMLEEKLRTLCGLDPRSQLLFFRRLKLISMRTLKAADTAALQNLAVILRLSLACIITPRFEFPALTDGTCRTTASKEQDVDECVRDADKRGAAN